MSVFAPSCQLLGRGNTSGERTRQVAFMVEGNLDYQELGCFADSSSDRVLSYDSTDYYLMTTDVSYPDR